MSLPAGTTKSRRIRPIIEYMSGWSAEKAGEQAVHVASFAIWEFEPIVSRSSLFQEKQVIYWFLIFSFFLSFLFCFLWFVFVFCFLCSEGLNFQILEYWEIIQHSFHHLSQCREHWVGWTGPTLSHISPRDFQFTTFPAQCMMWGSWEAERKSSYELRSQSVLLALCLYLFLECWLTVLAQDKIWSGRWLCKIDVPELILLTKIFPLKNFSVWTPSS